MKKRVLSMVMVLAMCLTLLPAPAFAAASEDVGLCPHHLEHTNECGFLAPTEDTPEGAPCTYECHICPVQDLIDALPEAADITAETATDVQAQLTAIDEAKLALTQEKLDALDFTRYQAAVSALLALEDMAGADVPELLAEVASGTCGENLTWSLDDAGTLTISGTGAMTDYDTSYTNNPAPWYDNRANVTSVKISEGVTSIGSYAFASCENVTTIPIPSSVTSIGNNAFAASGLTSIVIPGSVTSISNSMLYNCPNLTTVTIESGVESIGELAFWNCQKLNSVTIPETVTSIGKESFRWCDGLTSITIPGSVKSIGQQAFYGCTGLTSLNIESGVESIVECAFQGCSGLERVTIPGSVKSIGNYAFYQCTKLTSVELQNGIESIGEFVFELSGVKSLTIPGTVTSIGDNAFSGLGLTSVTIENGVESIGKGAFRACDNLTSIVIPDSVTSIGAQAFQNCHGLESVTLSQNITDIANQTFYDCNKLTSISIPAKVTSIGKNAFYNCNSIESVTFEGGAEQMKNIAIDTGNDVLMTFQPVVDSDGDGVYVLKNANDLFWFAQQVNTGKANMSAVLANDIDLKDGTVLNTIPWAPIGNTDENSYTGTFDGCGHLIKNMTANNSGSHLQGLFGHVGAGGAISNLGVAGSINGYNYVGGVCGRNEGTITNCYNTATVSGGNDVGGVCGENKGGTITNCYNTGAVNGSSSPVGGVCGRNEGTITNCYFLKTATINSTLDAVGDAYGTITNCENKTAEDFSGGAVAYLLQGTQSEQIWGQQLTGDTKDASPVPTGDNAKKVYKVTFATQSVPEYAVKYANPAGVSGLPTPPTAAEGYAFYQWSQTNDANGEAFTAETPVASDMIVYAVQSKEFTTGSVDQKIETAYGTEKTLDLSTCVKYSDSTPTAGNFTYEISSGNETLGATISGDTLTVPDTANAGSYTLLITATEKTPHDISLMSVNSLSTGNTITFNVTVTVEKVASSVSTAPTAIANLVYSGTAQALVTAGTAEGGTMEYSLDGTNYSAEIPTGTDAKGYTVWYKVAGDSNHNDTTPQSVPVTIGKGTPTYTAPEGLTATYGQTLADVTLPTTEDGVWTWSDSTLSVGNVGSQRFQATFTPTDTDNYNAVNNIEVTVEVGKATPVITTLPTANPITYGQTLGDSGLDGGTASVEGSFVWTDGTVKPAVSDSGNTPYSVTFTPTDMASYNTATGQITLTVNKATPVMTAPTANTLTYTGVPQALVAAGTTTGGTLQYSTDGVNYSTDIPEGINADTYTVHYKVVGDENYEGVSEESVSVTISPKDITGTVTISGTAAMNKTLTASVDPSEQTVNYQWYRDNTEIAGATSNTYTLTADDVGKIVKVTATGTGNYTGSLTSNPTGNVTEALPSITAWPTATPITYGQTLGDSGLDGGTASVDGTFSWTDGTIAPTVADSGKTYSVTFTPSVGGYSPVTGEVTVTVAPAPLTITAATLAKKTYDGTKTATVTGVTFDGLVNGETLALDTDYTATAAFNSANVNEANTATVTVTLDNANYALAVRTFDVTAAIAPKTITAGVTVEPDSYVYTGSAITPDKVIVKDGEIVIDTKEYTVSYSGNTDVGSATVTIEDAEGGNYIVNGTAAFEITKASQAALSITGRPDSIVYGDTFTLTISGGSGDGAVTWTVTEGAENATVDADGNVTVTGAGNFTLTATKAGGKNYQDASATIILTAGRKTLTVTGITGTTAKEYDGTTSCDGTGLTLTLDRVVTGDNVSISAAYTYDSADAGESKTITASGFTLTGAKAENYCIADSQTDVSAQVGKISKAPALNPKSGTLEVKNGRVETYSYGLAQLLPTLDADKSLGTVTYALGTISIGSYYTDGAAVSGTELTLPIQAVESETENEIGTVTITISSTNFADMTATITVKSINRTVPTGAPTLSAQTITYGQPLSTITLSGSLMDGGTPVPGTFTWSAPETIPNAQESYAAEWVFTPEDSETYAVATGTASIKVAPASLADAVITLNKTTLREGDEAPEITAVKLGDTTLTAADYTAEVPAPTAAGTYSVTVTGQGNYTGTATVTFQVNPVETTELPQEDDSGNALRLEVETGLSEVPEALRSIKNLNTPEKIETALRTAVKQVMANAEDNIAIFDVRLQYKDTNGDWQDVDPNNFPQNGVTAILPYPEETKANPSNYTFTVQHLISSGDHAGEMETLTYSRTEYGLQCTFNSLSPVAIGYQVKPASSGGGSGASFYAVTIEKAEHGKVTSNRGSAASGTTVTLTVTPDDGYKLDILTVTDSRGNELKLTVKDDGKYTFTMPGRAVTVTATFTKGGNKTCDGGMDCPSRTFTDLNVEAWYHESVDYVLQNGLMGGYGNGVFGPNENLSRAQLAQILYNYAGRPVVTNTNPFTDVANGAWYSNAIIWAASQGVVGGYGNGLFGPNDNITREQLAVMLWRYAGSPAATNKELYFNDADKAGGYALGALRWATENGILNGYGDGRLNPTGLATRAQVAQMLKNFLEDR